MIYLGALVVMLFASLWALDPLTFTVVHTYSLDNFKTLFDNSVYRTVTLRTVGDGGGGDGGRRRCWRSRWRLLHGSHGDRPGCAP